MIGLMERRWRGGDANRTLAMAQRRTQAKKDVTTSSMAMAMAGGHCHGHGWWPWPWLVAMAMVANERLRTQIAS